jgi:hypothetical protein
MTCDMMPVPMVRSVAVPLIALIVLIRTHAMLTALPLLHSATLCSHFHPSYPQNEFSHERMADVAAFLPVISCQEEE